MLAADTLKRVSAPVLPPATQAAAQAQPPCVQQVLKACGCACRKPAQCLTRRAKNFEKAKRERERLRQKLDAAQAPREGAAVPGAARAATAEPPARPCHTPGAAGKRGGVRGSLTQALQPRAGRLMAEAVPRVAMEDAADDSSAAGGSCESTVLPPRPSTLEPEPSRAAAGSAEHASEQRRGEASPNPALLAPAQLQAEPRYKRVAVLLHMLARPAL